MKILLNQPIISIIGIVGIVLITATLMETNRQIMRKLGFSSQQTQLARKYIPIRNLALLVYFAGVILLSNYIIDSFHFNIELKFLLALKIIGTILLMIPGIAIETKLWRRKYAVLKAQSNNLIVLDFNHIGLHQIFNPLIELILTLSIVLYTILVLDPFFIIYIHLALPWLLYQTLKPRNFNSILHLKRAYIWGYIGILANYFFVLYHLINGISEIGFFSGSLESVMGLILSIILVGRVVYPFLNIRNFMGTLDAIK